MIEGADLDPAGWLTRFILFTGKGGVGKTTTAAALAVSLADDGRRVLIVSTDPASNLSGVFTTEVGNDPTPIGGASGLDAMDIDPQVAADAYRSRVLDPLRATMLADEIDAIAEQLAGQCTVEIAAFDEFSGLLAAPDVAATYDHIIFDTAPTGHTLRLLELPPRGARSSSRILTVPAASGRCLRSAPNVRSIRTRSPRSATRPAPPSSWSRDPERGALAEADHAGRELASLGVTNQRLIVNGVLADPLPGGRGRRSILTSTTSNASISPRRSRGTSR